MIKKYVIYHSRGWDVLVTQGWITHEIIDHPIVAGLRVAVMVRGA